MRFAATMLAVAVALVVTSLPALAQEAAPRGSAFGPALGNVRYRTEITSGSAHDQDDYVSPLIAGEVLSVAVAADPRSGLVPTVALIDPGGVDRTPPLTSNRTRTTTSFRNLAVDRTGAWVVRVGGRDGTVGAYAVRFGVRPPARDALRSQPLGAGIPIERGHTFDAVDGASLTAVVRLAKGSAGGAVTALTGPAGDPVPFGSPKTKGAVATYASVPLTRGAGTYTIVVGLDEGAATYDLELRVAPPVRPKGRVALSKDEPRLMPVAAPFLGNSSQVLELTGANFSLHPLPTVWFGTKRASVLEVRTGGSRILVQPPKFPQGTVVEVAIVNPDGQGVVRDRYFEYSLPEPPRLAAVTPASASVYVGGTLTYGVRLTRPTPTGATIVLETVGGVGSVPGFVTIAPGGDRAAFAFAAAHAPASGGVRATYDGTAVEAGVSVVARPAGGGGGSGDPPALPDEIDISDWTIRQRNFARDFRIPAGTKLRRGDYVVVARHASRASFETYWGVVLGPDVVYLSNATSVTSADWPQINGKSGPDTSGETFELIDAAGASVDGPTWPMGNFGGENLRRIPGGPAGAQTSWTVSTNLAAPGGVATPGFGQPSTPEKHGVYVSEFSDTSGSGTYVYEFVELHFDGLPP